MLLAKEPAGTPSALSTLSASITLSGSFNISCTSVIFDVVEVLVSSSTGLLLATRSTRPDCWETCRCVFALFGDCINARLDEMPSE